MKIGDKVIVAKKPAFSDHRVPTIATFHQHHSEGWLSVMFHNHDYPVHFYKTEVQPYSDALWAAWQQWLKNAKQLDEQQRQLCAGRKPVELLSASLW